MTAARRAAPLLCLTLAICCLSGCFSLFPSMNGAEETPAALEETTPEETPSPSPSKAPSMTKAPAATAPPDTGADASHPPSTYTREEALGYLEELDAPDFTLETLEGDTVSLSDYRGKIVFLSFWQTWCPPCVQEMPHFDAMMKESDDVVVLAVNALPGEGGSLATAERAVRDFIDENGFSFPVLLDRDGAVFGMSAYASQYIPANYVIDREGVLRVRMQGAFTEEAMAAVLDVMRGLDW